MFNKTILNIVKNYFLKIDHEICGIIKKVKSNDKEVVILEIHPPIIEDDKRLNCSHVYYSKIIFHTHPNISKPYPSAEDILKIMKSFDIEYSVIFTSWGIWKLYSNKKFKFTEKNVKNDIKKINSLLVDLYYHYKDKNFDFLFINEVVNKINLYYKKFGLKIELILWKDFDIDQNEVNEIEYNKSAPLKSIKSTKKYS